MNGDKPLAGLLVVSIEPALAAPLCTGRLAEMGAHVIKVERAEGDFARGYADAANGTSSYFVWTNRGKKSVVIDFKKPEDAALLTECQMERRSIGPMGGIARRYDINESGSAFDATLSLKRPWIVAPDASSRSDNPACFV